MLGIASTLLDFAAILGVLAALQLAIGRSLRDRPLCMHCGGTESSCTCACESAE